MLLCLCGLVLSGDPPQTCSRCGLVVSQRTAHWRPTPDADWLAGIRDETGGPAGCTPQDPSEAW